MLRSDIVFSLFQNESAKIRKSPKIGVTYSGEIWPFLQKTKKSEKKGKTTREINTFRRKCPKTPKNTKNDKKWQNLAHPLKSQKSQNRKVRMRTFLFSLSKTEFRNRHPEDLLRRSPMVVVGDAHPNTMENQGLNNTSSALLSITACSRKSQNPRSRSDIVFCVFTLMQCCAYSKTTNRLKQLYPHEGEVSPQIRYLDAKQKMRGHAVTSCFVFSLRCK